MEKRFFLYLAPICLVIGLAPLVLLGQTTSIQIPPSIGEFIIRIVITRAIENNNIKREKLTYKRVYTVENLNDNEQVADTERQETILIEKNGIERMIESIRNGKLVKNSRVSASRFELLKVLEAMIMLDDFAIIRIEFLDGRPCYVIFFKPRPGQKANGDVEEIIARSEGEIYIDIEKFYIRKLSARMIRPYARGGILGWSIFNLTRANIEMLQEEFEGIIVMGSVLIIDKYSLFGIETFEKQTYTYKDYQQIQ